jgi:hypothetical protein
MEWKKTKECMANVGLLLKEKNEGWLKYLRFKRDWEMAMETIQKGGMDELLKSCWI